MQGGNQKNPSSGIEEPALHEAQRAGLQPPRVLQVIAEAQEQRAGKRAEEKAERAHFSRHFSPLAGSTRPAASPKPIVAWPSRAQRARSITSSPSSMKVRASPLGSSSEAFPPWVSSSSEPTESGVGPERVPEPTRSPGCRLQPFELWWAMSCAGVAHRPPQLERLQSAEIGRAHV